MHGDDGDDLIDLEPRRGLGQDRGRRRQRHRAGQRRRRPASTSSSPANGPARHRDARQRARRSSSTSARPRRSTSTPTRGDDTRRRQRRPRRADQGRRRPRRRQRLDPRPQRLGADVIDGGAGTDTRAGRRDRPGHQRRDDRRRRRRRPRSRRSTFASKKLKVKGGKATAQGHLPGGRVRLQRQGRDPRQARRSSARSRSSSSAGRPRPTRSQLKRKTRIALAKDDGQEAGRDGQGHAPRTPPATPAKATKKLKPRSALSRSRRAASRTPGSARASWSSVSRSAGLRSAAAGCSHGTSRRSPRHEQRAVHLGDLPPGREVRQRVAADRDDHARPDQRQLLLQPRQVVRDLVGLRVAVARRPRLDDVGDEHVVAREAGLGQQLVEQLARSGRRTAAPARPRCAPGASPTSITSAVGLPSPGTMLVAFSQIAKPQPRVGTYLLVQGVQRQGKAHARRHATRLRRAARRAGFPETIPVPPGSQPEGIASGKGTTLYVGSRVERLGLPRRRAHRRGRGARARPGRARGATGSSARAASSTSPAARPASATSTTPAPARTSTRVDFDGDVRQRRDRHARGGVLHRLPASRSSTSTRAAAARASRTRCRSPATSSTPRASTRTGSRRRRTARR